MPYTNPDNKQLKELLKINVPTEEKLYDVVIIGAGMVGASLACALAPSGLRIAIIEAVTLKNDYQPS